MVVTRSKRLLSHQNSPDEITRAPKQARGDQGELSNSAEQQQLRSSVDDRVSSPDWSHLPVIATEKIMSYISDGDKFRMACVCKSWSAVFPSPRLWRSRTFNFNYDYQNVSRRAQAFSSSHGAGLRYLHLRCGHPTFRQVNATQQALSRMLRILADSETELRKFTAVDFFASRYWSHRNIEKLCESLSTFFGTQPKLSVLDMHNMRLPYEHGLRVIQSLRNRAKEVVRELLLFDYFSTFPSSEELSSVPTVFDEFSRLEMLELNYATVSDALVMALAQSCPNLELLSLKATNKEPNMHVIASSTWRTFRSRLPTASLCMSLDGIVRWTDLPRILVPSAPLVSLSVITGWDVGLEWRLSQLFLHLRVHFSKTLEDVFLDLDNHRESIDEELIEFLCAAHRLTDLKIYAFLQVDTVREILFRQFIERALQMQYFFIRVHGLNTSQTMQLHQVKETYERAIRLENREFTIVTDPIVVLDDTNDTIQIQMPPDFDTAQ